MALLRRSFGYLMYFSLFVIGLVVLAELGQPGTLTLRGSMALVVSSGVCLLSLSGYLATAKYVAHHRSECTDMKLEC